MSKLDLQSGGIKTKLILHIEKIVFGITVLLVGLFVYFGFQRDSIDTTPEKVTQAASSATQHMLDSTWDSVKDQDERIKISDYTKAAKDANIPVPATPLEMVRTTRPRTENTITNRIDPVMLSLEKIEVRSGHAAFATFDKAQAAAAGNGGEYGSDYGGEYGGAGSCSGYGCGGCGEYGCGGYGSEGYGNAPAGPDPNAPPTLTPEQQMEFGPSRTAAGSKVEGKFYIEITGLVPLQKQKEAYELAFENAASYNPQRDYPNYMFYEVHRSEQNFDGTWTEWAKQATYNNSEYQVRKWAFRPDEVAATEYLHPLLTSPLPPLLMHDSSIGGIHSEIPKKELRRLEGPLENTDIEDPEEPINELPGGLPGRGPSGGYGPDSGEYGSGDGGYGSGAGGYGSGAGGYGSGGYGSGDCGYDCGGCGECGYGGSGGYGNSSYASFDAEFKMFRFYDTTVSSGKTYRYKVMLWVEDPNHPLNPGYSPDPRSLSNDVKSRIKNEVAKEEAAITQKTGEPFRVYWRKTDLSEASEPVTVPLSSTVLAGGITSAERRNYTRDPNNPVLLSIREPAVHLLGKNWDATKQVMVTQEEKAVMRGAIVATEKDTWVLDPGTMRFEKLEAYAMDTGTMVLDIRGGDKLPGRYRDDKKSLLTIPGEVLLIDAAGNISIHDELGDSKNFNLFNFAKPEVKRVRPKKRTRDPYGECGYGSGYDDCGGCGGY